MPVLKLGSIFELNTKSTSQLLLAINTQKRDGSKSWPPNPKHTLAYTPLSLSYPHTHTHTHTHTTLSPSPIHAYKTVKAAQRRGEHLASTLLQAPRRGRRPPWGRPAIERDISDLHAIEQIGWVMDEPRALCGPRGWAFSWERGTPVGTYRDTGPSPAIPQTALTPSPPPLLPS